MYKVAFGITGVICLVLMSGCKEIPIAIGEFVIPESDRMIVIEELTGASCSNCPKGTAAIKSIIAGAPERVAVIAIHGLFLSEPTSKSKYDFRNPKAKDLEGWFKDWFGKPSASVNRVATPSGSLMIGNPELWQAAVIEELKKPNEMNIILDGKFDADTRMFELNIAAIPLVALTGSYNITVYLTESKIIDAQKNGSIILDVYTHDHVLRDMITKFDGDSFGANLKKSEVINRRYTYTVPSPEDGLFVPENLEVVVMVSRNEVNDKSIVQAATIHVKK